MKLKLELLYKRIKEGRRKRLFSRRPDIRRWTSLRNTAARRLEKARKNNRVRAAKSAQSLPLQPTKKFPGQKARSKSQKVEPEQYQVQVARQKLTSVVTSAVNNLSGKYIVNFSVVNQEFGRLIEDIRKLKFDG